MFVRVAWDYMCSKEYSCDTLDKLRSLILSCGKQLIIFPGYIFRSLLWTKHFKMQQVLICIMDVSNTGIWTNNQTKSFICEPLRSCFVGRKELWCCGIKKRSILWCWDLGFSCAMAECIHLHIVLSSTYGCKGSGFILPQCWDNERV